jgi:hypothetical protein
MYVVSFIISKWMPECNSKFVHEISDPIRGSLEIYFPDFNLIVLSRFTRIWNSAMLIKMLTTSQFMPKIVNNAIPEL